MERGSEGGRARRREVERRLGQGPHWVAGIRGRIILGSGHEGVIPSRTTIGP